MPTPAPRPQSYSSRLLKGTLLTPGGWVRGSLEFSDRISAVHGGPVAAPGANQPIILPGFLDLHVHGGGGADVMDGGEAIDTLARLHARHGTTALLATTLTAPRAALEQALGPVRARVHERAPGAARVLGVHLEGPFINPRRRGAQPDATRPGTLEEVRALDAVAHVRVVTLAPELPGHLGLVRALADHGMRVQIGHTQASYDQAVAALEAGARGFTHLFNAMTGTDHRAPGAPAAALAHAEHAEIIADLTHVHAGALRAALRAIPRLYAVSDATAAAGMPDGPHRLGGQPVTKAQGVVRLADGTLAGSALTLDQALRNLVSLGVPLDDAARRVSTHAADYLGLSDRGRIARGAFADLAVLSPTLELEAVYVEGEAIALGG